MRKSKRITGIMMTGAFMFLLSVTAAAEDGSTVRDYPGFHGAGTVQTGPIAGSVSGDCWYDDNSDGDDGPGTYTYKRGWRYSPGGWWFQNTNGSWASDGWNYIDSRWYFFNSQGHMMTGWYTDGNGYKFYLNPTDDGTLGSMRTGWQIVDGKLYYFNTLSDGTLGRMLVNTTTPDGYHVGADGVMTP